MKFQIQTGPDNPILRTVCEPVARHEFAKYGKIGKQMVKYIKEPKNGGIGVAAPQIGLTKRLICCGLPQHGEDTGYPVIFMINPVILEVGEMMDIANEGCLSLPNTFGDVERPTSIVVEYFDEKGKKYKRSITGFGARVVQHEVDHINGVMFIDKLVQSS